MTELKLPTSRRRRGRRPTPGRCREPHARQHIAHAQRHARRRSLLQVRELPAHGRLQVPRRLQRAVEVQPAQRRAGVVAFSSGNHAQGIALSAKLLGIPATIVMPQDAPAAKVAATKGYGADVVMYDRYTEDREAIGRPLGR
ncbi:pyridoxal-phosphate dependent enzyme [Cupriavidus basilensis]